VQQVDAEIKAGTFFTNLQEEEPQKAKKKNISTPFFCLFHGSLGLEVPLSTPLENQGETSIHPLSLCLSLFLSLSRFLLVTSDLFGFSYFVKLPSELTFCTFTPPSFCRQTPAQSR
jgi:hypothetical protein